MTLSSVRRATTAVSWKPAQYSSSFPLANLLSCAVCRYGACSDYYQQTGSNLLIKGESRCNFPQCSNMLAQSAGGYFDTSPKSAVSSYDWLTACIFVLALALAAGILAYA